MQPGRRRLLEASVGLDDGVGGQNPRDGNVASAASRRRCGCHAALRKARPIRATQHPPGKEVFQMNTARAFACIFVLALATALITSTCGCAVAHLPHLLPEG